MACETAVGSLLACETAVTHTDLSFTKVIISDSEVEAEFRHIAVIVFEKQQIPIITIHTHLTFHSTNNRLLPEMLTTLLETTVNTNNNTLANRYQYQYSDINSPGYFRDEPTDNQTH